MDSIGAILKTAREEKGYSIEQVARETNIAKRYLAAIEAEDVSVFPGETYFIGFLRNYCEFLGQDSGKLIGIYKNMKIQEQPPPMEELLDSRGTRRFPLVFIILISVVVLGAAFWFLILPNIETSTSGTKPVASPADEQEGSSFSFDGERYEFKDEILEMKFQAGDVINVFLDGKEYPLGVAHVGDVLQLEVSGSLVNLSLDISMLFDLTGDGENDLKVLPRQIIAEDEAVVLYLDKYVESSDPVARSLDEAETAESGTVIAESEEASVSVGTAAALGTAGDASRESRIQVLLEDTRPGSFDLDVVFRGLCLVRYVADNNSREERYFHKSEVFRLEADSEIRLWISNAGSFKGKINGIDVPIGNPGEVATKLIRWEKDNETGKYQLKIIPVY